MEKHDARLNIQNENMIVEMGDREIEGGVTDLFVYISSEFKISQFRTKSDNSTF